MDTITATLSTEAPAILGYLAAAAAIGLIYLVGVLGSPAARARRVANATARAERRAAATYAREVLR